MSETKPRTEQIRLVSALTGEHILEDYIENCERPGMTIADLLDQVFDSNGNFSTTLFQFRIKDAGGGDYTLQFRVGSYVNPNDGWIDISVAVFDQILDAANLASTQAQTAATTATTQAGTATTQAGIAATQAGIATTQAGIATTQAGIATAAAAGQKLKTPARAATTGALPTCTYANGTAGVGATLTATANGALPAQDTVTLVNGEALLVKNQALAQHNGLYVVTQIGTGGTPWILTRQTESDTWSKIVAALVTVMEGSVGTADTQFLCTSNAGGTMGTTAITWSQTNANIADGAVSSTAKIANGVITYPKLAASGISTSSDISVGTPSKIVDAASLKAFNDTRRIVNPALATTSGVDVDLINGVSGVVIPTNAKKIELIFKNVSNTSNGDYRIRIGNASLGFVSTGTYGSISTEMGASSVATIGSSTQSGFLIRSNNSSTGSISGVLTLVLTDPSVNGWTLSGLVCSTTGTQTTTTSVGIKDLGVGEILDRIRFSTSAGTFDAGSVSTIVECW